MGLSWKGPPGRKLKGKGWVSDNNLNLFKMMVSPVGVTDEVLLNAKLMWAQQLICTYIPEIIQFARDIYDINLEIHSMKLGDNALLI